MIPTNFVIYNTMKDVLIASILFVCAEAFLLRKRLGYIGVWLLLITIVLAYGTRMKFTASVLMGILTVFLVIYVSGTSLREKFESDSGEVESESETEEKEDEKEEDKKEDKKEKSGEPEPHMDIGSTIMNAYKKMDPAQVQQMTSDTKELMATQKQLMETISMLGPQVQQGAELIKSFKGMFGGNISEVMKE
jgi:hypothetical protein